MTFLKTMALALPVVTSIGMGAAIAAPSGSHQGTTTVTQGLVQKAGYDVYVPTCDVVIVGYTAWGAPIFRRVCG